MRLVMTGCIFLLKFPNRGCCMYDGDETFEYRHFFFFFFSLKKREVILYTKKKEVDSFLREY